MRQAQQNRRGRGRGRKNQNPLTRSYESNGPDVKIRGTAAHIAEKYGALARDALASGDTVTAENYFQHAAHYNRIIMAVQAQMQQQPDMVNGAAARGRQPAAERRTRPEDRGEETERREAGPVEREAGGHERDADRAREDRPKRSAQPAGETPRPRRRRTRRPAPGNGTTRARLSPGATGDEPGTNERRAAAGNGGTKNAAPEETPSGDGVG